MRVLFLAPYAPFPPRGGGQQRMYQMLRILSERHDVHVLTFVADAAAVVALEPLRAFCTVTMVEAPVHSPGRRVWALLGSTTPDMVLRGQDGRFAQILAQTLDQFRFDVVQAESIEMAQYGRTRPRTSHAPLWVYDAFNAEFLIQRRAFLTDIRRVARFPIAAYSAIQWIKLHSYEQSLSRRFDLALTVSHRDRSYLTMLAPQLPMAVVPNGVDTRYFQPRIPTEAPDQPTLLFTGTLDFRPNIDALTWFAGHVWPLLHERRPDLRFAVVGQRPTADVQQLSRIDGIDIIGPVEDVRPWFERASVYVLPMRVGGGVRLKLMETWSMSVPCVTTTLGVEGVEEFVAGEHALVADSAPVFARAIVRLLEDPQLRADIARRGRRLVEERYDWRTIVDHMEQVWRHYLPA